MYNARKIVNERSAEAYNQNISAISNLSQNNNNNIIVNFHGESDNPIDYYSIDYKNDQQSKYSSLNLNNDLPTYEQIIKESNFKS